MGLNVKKFKKRLKSKKQSGRKPLSNLTLESLEARQLLTTTVFQQGLGGYDGQEDTVLYSRDPDVNFGTEGSISPDQQDSNGVRQGLVKFDEVFGVGAIPLGARINSATLVVDVVNDSNSAMQMSLYRMQENWSESSATWNTFGEIGGVQASEGEASDLPPDAILFDPETSGASSTAGLFDVTRSLEYWAAGANNFGWMIESAATNGWDFRTKESAQAQRPELTVDWTVPSSTEFQVLSTSIVANEGNVGTQTVEVEVARLGDLIGPASVDYAITAGSAQGSDFVAGTGTVDFADGEAFGVVSVTINSDVDLEGTESVEVTLTGAGVVSGRDVTTISIGDDDALINEVLANVTNAPGTPDETNQEYIELIGTPGAALDDYYFVVFEAEEEEDGGTGTGIADFVYDLSGESFGSNGLLVIAPTTWDYQGIADPATNIINTTSLDGAEGVLEDTSQTYALIRSSTAITQGTDYDTVGAYENDTNVAIGTGVGILDQLPSGAQLVDSVGVVEGGGGDRDRMLTTAEQGHPGIHVHQPTRYQGPDNMVPNATNVTSDAVSRRPGVTIANSIGVWWNGDIPSGDASGPIEYLNDSFFISVVAPDGSVLTPGSVNTLRTVFFSVADQDKEVAEADGSVTINIERTGDLNEVITVAYETVDFGSATAGADFTGVDSTVTFGVGESVKPVTIDILPDSNAEGFEQFRIDITSVDDDRYLITNGRSNETGAINGEANVTIADANVSIATFQEGVNGYFGTDDAYIDGERISTKFGQDPVIRVDQVKGEGEDTPPVVRPQQGLIKFDDIFGAGMDQVPDGSTIFGGFLTVNVQNPSSGADVRFFQMLQDWEQNNTTWADPQGTRGNGILNGVTPDDSESSATPDAVVPDAGRTGLVQIPLNADTLQAWANGSEENYGWSIVTDSGSLWAFNSADAFLPGTFTPELTILYTEPNASEGVFSLAKDDFSANETDGFAEFTIQRVGGSTGAASVDWALTGVTGDASDIVGALNGTASFADGEISKTVTVNVNDDNLVEFNETFEVTLSGSVALDRDVADLVVRDDDFDPNAGDLLLNEMWINSPGNDPPHEFVEIKGTAGIGMGSLYYVAIEGLIGNREGSAEKVVDLGTFQNGTASVDGNGYTILTPDAPDFAFEVPAGTTQIDALGSIAEENVSSQNDSTTYMILFSPFGNLTTSEFDYDWDNDGALELPAGVQIVDSVGVRVLGAEDQLYGPSTNQASFAVIDPDVDAISRGRNESDRNDGSAWFGGDLLAAGDDYLLYDVAQAFGVPVSGTALTPGEANTGSDLESPLVSLVSVTPNADGTINASFSGPISQINLGAADVDPNLGAGISITDATGEVVPGVNFLPTVSGFGTSTLTLSFSGPATVGGGLPSGTYNINFVGNGIIGNGRAVDVDDDGTSLDSFVSESVDVDGNVCTIDGDFDCSGQVAAGDLNLVLNNWGQDGTIPPTGWIHDLPNGIISAEELNRVLNNWGATSIVAGPMMDTATPTPASGRELAPVAVEPHLAIDRVFAARPIAAARQSLTTAANVRDLRDDVRDDSETEFATIDSLFESIGTFEA